MFDIAWSEMAVIVVVALIVISPKDLPVIFTTAKGWMGKIKALRQELTLLVNEITKEADISQAKQELQSSAMHINTTIRQIVDLEGNLRDAYDISDIMPDIKRDYQVAEPIQDNKLNPSL